LDENLNNVLQRYVKCDRSDIVHFDILPMFVEAGIDLDNINDEGDTAMMMTGARSLQSHKVMKIFLEAGAKSSFINK